MKKKSVIKSKQERPSRAPGVSPSGTTTPIPRGTATDSLRLFRAVQRSPRDPQARLQLAEALWLKGDAGSAWQHLAMALQPDAWPTLDPEQQGRAAALTLALGHAATALRYYESIGQAHGYRFDALLGRARCHLHLKQYEEAILALQACRQNDAKESASWHLLFGTAHLMLKEWATAEHHLRRCLEIEPQNSLALNNLGLRYKNSGENRDVARQYFNQALANDPNLVDAAINLASLMMESETDELDDAYKLLKNFEASHPHNYLLHHALGQIQQRRKQWDAALEHYLKALALHPQDADLLTNIGIWHFDNKNYDEAISWLQKALEIDPSHPDANHFLGTSYANLGRLDLQLPILEKLVQRNPEDPVIRFQFAWHLLGAADWSLGFREYGYRPSRCGATAAANGTPLANRLPADMTGDRILVVQDQGIGDEWFFLRFLPELQKRGAQLHYWTSSKLAPLLERTGWFSRIWREPPPPQDFEAAILVGDLPFLLGFTTGQMPPPPLPIQPISTIQSHVQTVLKAFGPPPYVGVTWRGGTNFLSERGVRKRLLDKAIPIDRIASWLPSDATIISLQRNPGSSEISLLAQKLGRPVLDAAVFNEDLEQVLGLLACLDHYYAVSNTNVHLAASLGVPCTVFVPMPPEWRWMAAGDESPWFPGYRVVRQLPGGAWPSP